MTTLRDYHQLFSKMWSLAIINYSLLNKKKNKEARKQVLNLHSLQPVLTLVKIK